jgi:hypothetical protein
LSLWIPAYDFPNELKLEKSPSDELVYDKQLFSDDLDVLDNQHENTDNTDDTDLIWKMHRIILILLSILLQLMGSISL